jgi:hypothetical protein
MNAKTGAFLEEVCAAGLEAMENYVAVMPPVEGPGQCCWVACF